jgi:hypothetical protein
LVAKATDPDRKENIVRDWMNYVGAALLVLAGVFLYSLDSDVPTAGTPVLALPLIVVGLIWGGLAIRQALTISGGRGKRNHEDH